MNKSRIYKRAISDLKYTRFLRDLLFFSKSIAEARANSPRLIKVRKNEIELFFPNVCISDKKISFNLGNVRAKINNRIFAELSQYTRPERFFKFNTNRHPAISPIYSSLCAGDAEVEIDRHIGNQDFLGFYYAIEAVLNTSTENGYKTLEGVKFKNLCVDCYKPCKIKYCEHCGKRRRK